MTLGIEIVSSVIRQIIRVLRGRGQTYTPSVEWVIVGGDVKRTVFVEHSESTVLVDGSNFDTLIIEHNSVKILAEN